MHSYYALTMLHACVVHDARNVVVIWRPHVFTKSKSVKKPHQYVTLQYNCRGF